MPMYRWVCDKCKIDVELIRVFDDYNKPPTKEELPTEGCDHEWRKIIGVPNMVRGVNWNTKKGHH